MILTPDKAPGIEALYQLGQLQQSWALDAETETRVAASHQNLEKMIAAGDQTIYGLHTYFGHNSIEKCDAGQWVEHQLGLLSYLTVGFGPGLSPLVVRRALRLQTYKVGLGYSGVHPETFQRLRQLADSPALPTVPSVGSLGASGDLIPMAHAIAPVFQKQDPQGPRDILALLNTNAMMASLAIECHFQVSRLSEIATGGWLIHAEALGWKDQGKDLFGLKARSTQQKSRSIWLEKVENWQKILGNKHKKSTKTADLPVQERYSIRCAPQILIDIEENLEFSALKICEEALGLADNPVLFENRIWHGGLFYTAGLATASELMQNATLRITELMDRQILLIVTPTLSHGLPANLMRQVGDNVKGLHQLASAIVQKIRGMSQPASLLSFSCESHNQDVVPASMTALLLLSETLVLAEELARIHRFIGERAWAMRYQNTVPKNLYLSSWPDYKISDFLADDQIFKHKI